MRQARSYDSARSQISWERTTELRTGLKRAGRSVIATATLAVGLGMQFASPASATVTSPAWEPDSPNSQGALLFYDSSGNLLTTGTNLNHLFDYAAATAAGDSGAVKATMYFAIPNHSLPTGSWSKQQASGSTAYPNSSAPAPITGPGFTKPLVTLKATDGDLNNAIGGAFTLDPTAGYANLIQVRVIDNLGNATSKYFDDDIAYNTSGTPSTVDGVTVPANGWALVYPAPTTTTTTVNAPGTTPTVASQTTFTASVSPDPGGGTASFSDNGTAIGSCQNVAVSAGSASCTTTFTTAGSHPVTATFAGNANGGTIYGSSTSSATSITVNPTNTTVALSPTTATTAGTQVTYTATVSPTPDAGTTVAFNDGTGNPATTNCATQAVSASNGTATCTVTYTTANNSPGYTVNAAFGGDSSYNSSSTTSSVTQVVNPASTTTGLATSAPTGAAPGASVTYTATVSPTPDSGTTVAFTDGTGNPATTTCATQSVSTSTGQATCTVSYTSPGSYGVTAHFAGDTNFTASTSSIVTQAIKAGTTTGVTSDALSGTVYGQSVTFTATVSVSSPGTGNPDGSVTFTYPAGGGSVTLCNAVSTAAGAGNTSTASCGPISSLPVGTQMVTGTYSGSSTYSGSASSAFPETVSKAGTTTAVTPASPPAIVSGQNASYTATVSVVSPGSGNPTGTMTFRANGAIISACSSLPVSSDAATCTTNSLRGYSSPVTITANYNGDGNFLGSGGSGPASVSQTVNPDATTTAVTSSSPSVLINHPVTYTATETASAPGSGIPADGTVEFFDGGVAITGCTSVALASATGTATCGPETYAEGGTHTITATYSGDTAYHGSTSSGFTQTVTTALPPSAPMNVRPTIAGAGDGTVNLTWDAPASSGTSPLLGYDVFVGTSPGGESFFPENAGLIKGVRASVTGLTDGVKYYLTVEAVNAVGDSVASTEVSATPRPGLLMGSNTGGVYALGSAPFDGALAGRTLAEPIVGMASTPDPGYWLVASDGGVFAFGDAHFYGSLGKMSLKSPIVGFGSTPDGRGYRMVAGDGGVFAFGDARFFGSLGTTALKHAIVGIATSRDGRGYWLVSSDGGVTPYGDAPNFGSLPANITLAQPIVAIVPTGDGLGYWLVAGDGGVFSFGDAKYIGSVAGFVGGANHIIGGA